MTADSSQIEYGEGTMHTISIDGQPFCRTGSLTTVSQVLAAHRLGREAHLPITVELWGGFQTYTVAGTERRETR